MSEELNTNVNPVKAENKGFNVTSMVLGIVSAVLFCVYWISIPCAILAIIFSVVGWKRSGHGMGIAGLIIGIVVISLWVLFFGSAFITGFMEGFSEAMY